MKASPPVAALRRVPSPALALLLLATAGVVHGQAIDEFPIPTPDSEPTWITAGPDGNLWFTEAAAGRIGRITTEGAITEFVIPTPDSHPEGIATGADGNLWFTELFTNKIGRITPVGEITEFPMGFGTSANKIAAGPDGNLWFTAFTTLSGSIGRITTAGVITLFPIAITGCFPQSITAGADGNVWFIDSSQEIGENVNYLVAVAPDGSMTSFSIPVAMNQFTRGMRPDPIRTSGSPKSGRASSGA